MSNPERNPSKLSNKYQPAQKQNAAPAIGVLLASAIFYGLYSLKYISFDRSIALSDALLLALMFIIFAALSGLIVGLLIHLMSKHSKDITPNKNGEQSEQNPIIDQPSLQNPIVRCLELLISMTVWGFFLYLFQSLFTVVFWIFGGNWVYSHIFDQVALEGTKQILLTSIIFGVVIFLIMLAWANWNYWRFGRLERRKPRPPVPDETIAIHFGLPEKSVSIARNIKIARIVPHDLGMEFKIESKL